MTETTIMLKHLAEVDQVRLGIGQIIEIKFPDDTSIEYAIVKISGYREIDLDLVPKFIYDRNRKKSAEIIFEEPSLLEIEKIHSDNDFLGVYPLLRFFNYKHLPFQLQERSKIFHDLAWKLVKSLSMSEIIQNPEVEMSLRKLLEAKDCFVRTFV